MIDDRIYDFLSGLHERGLLDVEGMADAVEEAEKAFGTRVALWWDEDDVTSAASEMGMTLDASEIRDVLWRLKEEHDASIGVNWDVVENTILTTVGLRKGTNGETPS